MKLKEIANEIINWIDANPVRRLRRDMLLTVEEFASYFNVSSSTVRRWEVGTAVPPDSVQKMIEEYYGERWADWYTAKPTVPAGGIQAIEE